jgi:hypothetical protein
MTCSKEAHIELNAILKKWETSGVGSAYADLTAFLAKHPYIPVDDEARCEIHGCPNDPVYEAWMRPRDPFTQTPTGMIVRVTICEEHKSHPWLCANQTKEEAYGTSKTKDATS